MPMAATPLFSSSATLYGYPDAILSQRQHQAPDQPHGHTKAAVEQMLNDLHASAPTRRSLACVTSTQLALIRLAALGKPAGHPQQLFPL